MKHSLTPLLCLFSLYLLSAQAEERFADIRIVTTSNKDYEDYSPLPGTEMGLIFITFGYQKNSEPVDVPWLR